MNNIELDYIKINKYKNNKQLWDRYDNGIPSVTTILSIIQDTSFDYVKRMYPDAVAKASKVWSINHKKIEDFYSDGSAKIDNRLMKYMILHWINVINTEKTYITTIDECKFSWTIDCVATTKDNKLLNIDYKFTKVKNKKYLLQLAWYKLLNGNDWCLIYFGGKQLSIENSDDKYLDDFKYLLKQFYKLIINNND